MPDGRVEFEITANGQSAISSVKNVTNAISAEAQKWDRAADNATDQIEDSFSDMSKGIAKEAKSGADSVENSFVSMAKKVATAFSLAKIGQAVVDFGKQAIEAASNLSEVQNVVDVTFGDSASTIESWAKQAGTQFGLTETQAKQFTSTLGAMMKSAGVSGNEIVQMSTDLAGLAADMASFYNLDFETAFQKIRSGISGETEPLKQLGINMSVANLEAFALEKGITKAFNAMSQQEQTILRYQYLMKATADAQGDFARTSDGFANATRKLQTNLESIKTAIGSQLLGTIEQAVNGLNNFFTLLLPDASKRTVLDDFADIDLKTESKIAQIEATAEKARLLTEELERIQNTQIEQAGIKVNKFVEDLTSINLEQGKNGIINDFLSKLSANINALAAVQGTSAEGAQDWLDKIATSAGKLKPEDVQGWKDLCNAIKEGLPGIENTDFGAQFFSALADGFSDVAQQSSLMEWTVDQLGNKTSRTAEEQALWLETCKQLVQTIPGLSSILNTQTGEIEGGTQAIHDYIDAWEQGQKKLAMLGAIETKQTALDTKYAQLPEYELDMAVAQRRARKQAEAIQAIYDQYGIDWKPDDVNLMSFEDGTAYGMSGTTIDSLNEMTRAYDELSASADQATQVYTEQKSAYDEASAALDEYRATVEEMPGAIDEMTTAAEQWSTEQVQAAQQAANALETALKAVEDYARSVRTSTAQAVDSMFKGFTNMQTPVQAIESQISALKDQLDAAKISQDEYNKKVAELNAKKDALGIEGMKSGIESQTKFMEEYLQNLEYLQGQNLSSDFLAQFADGSQASADYINSLVETMKSGGEEGKQQVAELDAQFQAMQAKKEEFVNALTEQKLAADQNFQAMQTTVEQAYQAMVAAAGEAAAGMDVSAEAGTSMSNTISAMASAIADHTSEVQTAVDGIIQQLQRLNNFGVHINIPGVKGGGINFELSLNGSHATGLDWVPFDGYLAELHEGESVLTAEENRIWQRFKNGGISSRNVDYDTMGAVMSDSIKPGGDVYLDGRVVGSVISKQQASSYRSLQRSGWQA